MEEKGIKVDSDFINKLYMAAEKIRPNIVKLRWKRSKIRSRI